MTIFVTTCFAVAVIRFIEVIVHFFINCISSLTSKKKAEKVLHTTQKRIAAYVSPELHAMIKSHAHMLDMTITDYILIAINEKLKRDLL